MRGKMKVVTLVGLVVLGLIAGIGAAELSAARAANTVQECNHSICSVGGQGCEFAPNITCNITALEECVSNGC